MAVGDDALAAGYPLVPSSGADGLVKYGSREINRTRDFIAQVRKLVGGSKASIRSSAGITSGTATPSNSSGDDGDIYLKTV